MSGDRLAVAVASAETGTGRVDTAGGMLARAARRAVVRRATLLRHCEDPFSPEDERDFGACANRMAAVVDLAVAVAATVVVTVEARPRPRSERPGLGFLWAFALDTHDRRHLHVL